MLFWTQEDGVGVRGSKGKSQGGGETNMCWSWERQWDVENSLSPGPAESPP